MGPLLEVESILDDDYFGIGRVEGQPMTDGLTSVIVTGLRLSLPILSEPREKWKKSIPLGPDSELKSLKTGLEERD